MDIAPAYVPYRRCYIVNNYFPSEPLPEEIGERSSSRETEVKLVPQIAILFP